MRFRDARLRPAIEKVLGPGAMAQGPPPFEPTEVHNIMRGGS